VGGRKRGGTKVYIAPTRLDGHNLDFPARKEANLLNMGGEKKQMQIRKARRYEEMGLTT